MHARHVRAVQLDQRIIDAATGQWRHQVFDRSDGNAVTVADGGRQAGIDDMVPKRRDDGAAAGDIGAFEMDTGIFLGRMQRHLHPDAGMKADAGAINRRFQGSLLNHPSHSAELLSVSSMFANAPKNSSFQVSGLK